MSPAPREELRIALALNGGVGLAVWNGGVANELERLVSRRGSYGALLDVTATDPRVDVISGSSAGGINGALLAMALAHGSTLAPLRSLWVDQGDLGDLLRDPLDRRAPSLMRGDDYFLPQLRRAFAILWNPNENTRRPAATTPIVLSLTTTLLQGEPNNIPDDYGTVVTDLDYRARFVFERGPEVSGDPFADPGIVDQLALAARSTASFPGAFEASFVPVQQGAVSDGHPNMRDRLHPPLGVDRYVVDGGVLDNKPIEAAVQAVFRQRAHKPVRRLLAYVVPDPGTVASALPATPGIAGEPSVATVALASVLTLPRYQSINEGLRALRDNNRIVTEHRQARRSLVGELAPDVILRVAGEVFPAYAAVRKDTSIGYIVEAISAELSAQTANGLPFRGRREWLRGQFAARTLPWVPTGPPLTVALPQHAAAPGPAAPPAWNWGTRAVERLVPELLALLRETQELAMLAPDAAAGLATVWDRAFDAVAEIRRLRDTDRRFWAERSRQLAAAGILTEPSGARLEVIGAQVDAWLTETLTAWRNTPFTFGLPRFAANATTIVPEAAHRLADELAATALQAGPIAEAVLEASATWRKTAGVGQARTDLGNLAGFLVPNPDDPAEPCDGCSRSTS
jgi:patatin-related protein